MQIKNFSYTIPTVGRIAIGEKREANGRKLPAKLNHFVITAQHKRDGNWVPHGPALEAVANEMDVDQPENLTEIPVRVMFDDVDLNLRQRYEAYDQEGRMACAGDGQKAMRRMGDKIEEVACPSAEHCEFGKRSARCSMMTRMNVKLDVSDPKVQEKDDPLSSFIFRSSGINTARTLYSKLTMLKASIGHLAGVPLMLKMRQKSSNISRQSIFYYVDVLPRVSMAEAHQAAKAYSVQLEQDGIDQAALEEVVRNNLANGPFEDSQEDFEEAADFMPTDATSGRPQVAAGQGKESVSVPPPERRRNSGTHVDPFAALEGLREDTPLKQAEQPQAQMA